MKDPAFSPLHTSSEQLDSGIVFLTIGQVALVCDTNQATVREWIASGLLAVHQMCDGSVRINLHALAVLYALQLFGHADFPTLDIPEAD